MTALSPERVRALRMRAQGLFPRFQTPPGASGTFVVAQLVRSLGGIQAQDVRAARLALRVRSMGLLDADVERARVQERTIIRTWGQRGTLHLIATEDTGWLLPLLGPVFIAASRRRRAELGLDENTCTRGIRAVRDALASHGPLTRAELVEQLALHGIHLEGQARPHLLSRAALEGVICFGPDRGTEPTYVLLTDWAAPGSLEKSLTEETAYIELTHRYLSAYGPAMPEDMAAWSGLPLSKIRAVWRQIADQLIEVEIGNTAAWMLKSRATWLDEPFSQNEFVCLLPAFDIYLLGYQSRDLTVPRQYAKSVNAGGGMLHPVVLVNGRAVGTWKSERRKSQFDVIVEPFEPLDPIVYPKLETEIADIARFLETQVQLKMQVTRHASGD